MNESLTALLALAFALGARHGLDADHLATIDGLTRYNLGRENRAARSSRWGTAWWCWRSPRWRGWPPPPAASAGRRPPGRTIWASGSRPPFSWAWGCLICARCLRAVLVAPRGKLVAPVGLKAGLLGRLQRASHPLAIAGVGALFALSFDTLSQASLFAVMAARHGGLAPALGLGASFLAGMLAVDGLNGLWIAGLLKKADRRARIASRVMGLTVSGLSLAVAAYVLTGHYSESLGAWFEDHGLLAGIAVICLISFSFLVVSSAHEQRQAFEQGTVDRAGGT
ncbi:MAG: nickel transporter [Candidatus Protistobacter heckmanni]|nr:nickel transporter [Candidatus Protistobacter heckmanni]